MPKSNKEPKKGFNVGPRFHNIHDTYIGHLQKKKRELIHRAKLKKQFSKVLKEEGIESKRLGAGPRPSHQESTESLDKEEASPAPKKKRHRAGKKLRAEKEEPSVEEKRALRQEAKQEWAAKTKRGQPNLNHRIELLLGKIEK